MSISWPETSLYLPRVESNAIEDYKIKNVRNLFRLKKENKAIVENIIMDGRNRFILANEYKGNKNKIIRDIRIYQRYQKRIIRNW